MYELHSAKVWLEARVILSFSALLVMNINNFFLYKSDYFTRLT